MTDRSYEIPQDADFRSLVRVVSACTLPLGICSRFADRRLSVFVIEFLRLAGCSEARCRSGAVG